MIILPQQLKGKTIKDCYESDGKIHMEFTNGDKIIFSVPIEKFYAPRGVFVTYPALDLKPC